MTTLAEIGRSSSKWARQIYMADAKLGKTTWLVASLLGALPEQTGAVVSAPKNLHLIGIDEGFADGLSEFIVGQCKKPESLLDVTVHSLSEDRRRSGLGGEWDFNFFNKFTRVISQIEAATKGPGVHAVVVSGLTSLAEGLYSGLAGIPGGSTESGKIAKGGGMDQSKWQDLGRQIISLRNRLHIDQHHVFWEAHIHQDKKMQGNQEVMVEALYAGKGAESKHFAANVEYIFRLRRETAKFPNTLIDKCFLDTKPTMGTFTTGRKSTLLNEKETDLLTVLTKFGKNVHGKPLT